MGCQGVIGPFPSAFLDKFGKNCYKVKEKILIPYYFGGLFKKFI
jgi:hypothetical protein